MDRVKFLDAIAGQDTNDLSGADRQLADNLLIALSEISIEFHREILDLLDSVSVENEFVDLVATITSLPAKQRTQLIAFITTGDATEEFINSLDHNPRLQHAVDIAFTAHVGQIHDLDEALDNAEEFLREHEKESNEDADS